MGVFGRDSSCTFFVIHRSKCAIRLSSCKAGEQNGSFGRTLFEQRRIPKCANGMEALAARNHKTKSIQPVCDLGPLVGQGHHADWRVFNGFKVRGKWRSAPPLAAHLKAIEYAPIRTKY